jgi:hypothetical protein
LVLDPAAHAAAFLRPLDAILLFVNCALGSTSLFTSPLREWLEYFALIIAAAEFAPTWKNAYYVESSGIPDDDDHLFCALNRDMFI